MKDTYVFPQLWYIRLTDKNKDTICQWHENGQGGKYPPHAGFKSYMRGLKIGSFIFSGGSWSEYVSEDSQRTHSMITFDEFKEYVLGELPFPDTSDEENNALSKLLSKI